MKKARTLFLALLAATAAWSFPAYAQNAPQAAAQPATQPMAVSVEKREIVTRVEKYLNSIKTLRADFMQTLNDGSSLTGKIAISRPGRMRLEYDKPSDNLLVADGSFVHVWDGVARTSSSVPLGSSLADLILRENVKLSGDISVKNVTQYPGIIQVTLTQKGNPTAGTITLEFDDAPLRLKNWRVVDAQGYETRVALSNDKTNVEVPSSFFFYRDPDIGKGRSQ
jgi:outer membrane lipoprotein-sorting protein